MLISLTINAITINTPPNAWLKINVSFPSVQANSAPKTGSNANISDTFTGAVTFWASNWIKNADKVGKMAIALLLQAKIYKHIKKSALCNLQHL